MENFMKGEEGSRHIHKKIVYFMENGGGFTQSIKSLTEKVKENPYFQNHRGGVKKICSFSTFRQFLTFDCSSKGSHPSLSWLP